MYVSQSLVLFLTDHPRPLAILRLRCGKYSGGYALFNRIWNASVCQRPACGASGMEPVKVPLELVKVGSQLRSKPLAGSTGSMMPGLPTPSDSPGGFTHTYASIPGSGATVGRSPIPPGWLRQLPRWWRRSTRDSSTNVSTSELVDCAVGRSGPPQPLRG